MFTRKLSILFYVAIMSIFLLPQTALAKDAWLFNYDGYEVYIVQESIYSPTLEKLHATIKFVEDGELHHTENWHWIKVKTSNDRKQWEEHGATEFPRDLRERLFMYCWETVCDTKDKTHRGW